MQKDAYENAILNERAGERTDNTGYRIACERPKKIYLEGASLPGRACFSSLQETLFSTSLQFSLMIG